MSDGMTDIARDNRRADEMNVWLEAVVKWLERGDSARLRRGIDELADAVEAVPRGYWGSSLGFRKHSDRLCTGLAKDDAETWRKFLAATDEAPARIRARIAKLAPAEQQDGER